MNVIAAGFSEFDSDPGLRLFAILISFAYMIVLGVPSVLLVRRVKEGKKKALLSSCILVVLVSPFIVRMIAILKQGPNWADWHFTWLYLLGAILVSTTYFVLAWLFSQLTKRSNQSTQRIRASHTTRRINTGPLDPLL